ncbi:protocadherin-15-like protein [Lates japonicus]|uniref:Protocadherin-15-like protein n=1 Tax=Lates japonicus TaxID=270547 RepID=A0AAD3M278_LATJO|nr:protocadherin-15-like protein [Lates japonicus]
MPELSCPESIADTPHILPYSLALKRDRQNSDHQQQITSKRLIAIHDITTSFGQRLLSCPRHQTGHQKHGGLRTEKEKTANPMAKLLEPRSPAAQMKRVITVTPAAPQSLHLTQCKLSRPGPPATIVTIDEESPNGPGVLKIRHGGHGPLAGGVWRASRAARGQVRLMGHVYRAGPGGAGGKLPDAGAEWRARPVVDAVADAVSALKRATAVKIQSTADKAASGNARFWASPKLLLNMRRLRIAHAAQLTWA